MNLVGKPSQMTVFDALYSIAAGDGRGEALFGSSYDLARNAYERTLIGDGYPAAYIEFPLLGSPGFDLLSVHGVVQPGSRFAPGAGFGYQAMLDWFSGVCDRGVNASCGIELDTSAGETERAGVYLQYRKHHNLIISARTNSCHDSSRYSADSEADNEEIARCEFEYQTDECYCSP